MDDSGLTKRQETKLEAMAIRNRWPVDSDYREGVIRRLLKIVLDPESKPRDVTQAAKAIVAADKINLDDEKKDIPIEHHHTGAIDIRQVLDAIENDERFEEFARSSIVREYSGVLGGNGQQGKMEVTASLNGHRPSRNGHDPQTPGGNPGH